MTAGTAVGFTACVIFPIGLMVAITPVKNWKIIWGAVAIFSVAFLTLLGLILLIRGAAT